jgi:hypothetical protein
MGEALRSISNPIKLAEADRPAFESFGIAVLFDVRGNFRIHRTKRFFMGLLTLEWIRLKVAL